MTENSLQTQIVVLGGGPAGYVAAKRAAQLGADVVLVEERPHLGGTCLNVGCIPTKALLHTAKAYASVKELERFGVKARGELDWGAALEHKSGIVARLTKGVDHLVKKAGVRVLTGRGRFAAPRRIEVMGESGTTMIDFDKAIICTGSVPVTIPGVNIDQFLIVSSDGALVFPEVPESLIILGGGVIGCEFASIYQRLGAQVTIVELKDQLLPGEDLDASRYLMREMKKLGVKMLLGQKVTEATAQSNGVVVSTDNERLEAQRMLVSVGRKPNLGQLGLEQAGVNYGPRGIFVEPTSYETSAPGIYAAGDVIGGYQLAHAAFHEGAGAAEAATGYARVTRAEVVPRCVYTSPEIAAVGLTEVEARARYGDILVGNCQLQPNGKALIEGENRGFVKLMGTPDGVLVGAVIVGPNATELISELSLAVTQSLTLRQLADAVHPHPTVAESVREAALAGLGESLHG